MTAARHAAIVLAAGGSRRLGSPKQLVVHRGETLVRRAVRLALTTAPAQCLVVVGSLADDVAAAAGPGASRVSCPRWELGMGESLACGLSAVEEPLHGALVLACDQPGLTSRHLRALVAAWRGAPSRAAASGYGGVAGIPAVLPRSWFEDVVARCAGTDRGARDVLLERMNEVVVVPSSALERDVDVAEDLERSGSARLTLREEARGAGDDRSPS